MKKCITQRQLKVKYKYKNSKKQCKWRLKDEYTVCIFWLPVVLSIFPLPTYCQDYNVEPLNQQNHWIPDQRVLNYTDHDTPNTNDKLAMSYQSDEAISWQTKWMTNEWGSHNSEALYHHLQKVSWFLVTSVKCYFRKTQEGLHPIPEVF